MNSSIDRVTISSPALSLSTAVSGYALQVKSVQQLMSCAQQMLSETANKSEGQQEKLQEVIQRADEALHCLGILLEEISPRIRFLELEAPEKRLYL